MTDGVSWDLDDVAFRWAAQAFLLGRRSWAAPVLIMAGYPLDRRHLARRLRDLPPEPVPPAEL